MGPSTTHLIHQGALLLVDECDEHAGLLRQDLGVVPLIFDLLGALAGVEYVKPIELSPARRKRSINDGRPEQELGCRCGAP